MFGGGLFGGDRGPGGFFGGGVPGRFDHQYQVFPVSFMGKEELEKGNKRGPRKRMSRLKTAFLDGTSMKISENQ